jgi:predicted HTH transcriptional regulator
MVDHLKICSLYQGRNTQNSKQFDIKSLFTHSGSTTFDRVPLKITQDLVEEMILKFFVSGNIPFQQADNEHFHALVSLIKVNDQQAHCPSKRTV